MLKSILEVGEVMIYLPKIYRNLVENQNDPDVIYRINNCELKNINSKKNIILKKLLSNFDDIYSLTNNNRDYSNTSCKNDLHIYDIIREKYYQNYDIIIICKRSKIDTFYSKIKKINVSDDDLTLFFELIPDINNLSIKNNNAVMICQINNEENKIFINKMKEKYKNIELINIISDKQKLIKKSTIALAHKCNYMIIIGEENYSNAVLYNLCNNITQTIMVSSIDELLVNLNKIDFLNSKIGITGGMTSKDEIEACKYLLEFYKFYKNEKEIFEFEIKKYNLNFHDKLDNMIVKEAIEKFVNINSGGKYLRATLIALGYKIFSHKSDNIYLPLSIAYETFQTSILIHDDIIDNATKRRGKDTIPTSYKKDFKNDLAGFKVANDLGICLGDLGFYLANKIMIDAYSQNTNILNVLDYYNNVVIKTIKGEIIDVKLPYDVKYENKKCNEESINEIYKLKTAWYTIIGPFCLGALLADKNKDNIKKYEKILENIGIAFQIKDDIIGIYGNSKYIGKSTNSDISEFKQTILYSYIFNEKKQYLKQLNKYYGKDNLKEDEFEKVKQIFKESGALDNANKVMNKLFSESIDFIKNSDLPKKYKEIILGFIYYLKIRQK